MEEIYDQPKDPSKVSLYGRSQVGTENKPLISNLEFKTLLDEVMIGNPKAYDKANERYSFETKQKSIIEHYLLTSKNKTNGDYVSRS